MTAAESDQRKTLQSEFPSLENLLYANHAAMSPWPRTTCEAVAAFAQANAEHGPADYREWLRLEVELRQRVARLLSAADSDDISLLRNTTDGIGILAGGLDWRPGDNVVTAKDEFLTNQMAWDALADRGVEIRGVDIRAARDAEAALLERMDAQTRVLTVSAVQWNDGFRLDLAVLGAGCRTRGVLFFVDAIQQFGALPIDVEECAIDCLAAGSHKWQMGPEGIGVFYCRPDVRLRLALRQHGWRMLDDPYRFDRPDRAPSRSGRRFEPGSPNTMGQVALNASLRVLEDFGQARVAKRVLDNTARLFEALEGLPGVRVVSRPEPERRSGIVSFTAGERTDPLYRELTGHGVICTLREGMVRLSPHFYQHGKPLQDLLNSVEDATFSAR